MRSRASAMLCALSWATFVAFGLDFALASAPAPMERTDAAALADVSDSRESSTAPDDSPGRDSSDDSERESSRDVDRDSESDPEQEDSEDIELEKSQKLRREQPSSLHAESPRAERDEASSLSSEARLRVALAGLPSGFTRDEERPPEA